MKGLAALTIPLVVGSAILVGWRLDSWKVDRNHGRQEYCETVLHGTYFDAQDGTLCLAPDTVLKQW